MFHGCYYHSGLVVLIMASKMCRRQYWGASSVQLPLCGGLFPYYDIQLGKYTLYHLGILCFFQLASQNPYPPNLTPFSKCWVRPCKVTGSVSWKPLFDTDECGLNCALCIKPSHDDVIKWKIFPRYWPFVWGIHQSSVNSPHKGQWRGALVFSLICAWINGWINNGEAGDLRRHRAHYDVTVMVTPLEIVLISLSIDSRVAVKVYCSCSLVCSNH